jgi:hypothetical protein
MNSFTEFILEVKILKLGILQTNTKISISGFRHDVEGYYVTSCGNCLTTFTT